MSTLRGRVGDLARRQHDVIAAWQLRQLGLSKGETDAALRGLRRVFRGVCALGDLTELGWFMAAALAGGPGAAISHGSGLMLLGLRPYEPGDLHVSVRRGGGRAERAGIVPHRRVAFDTTTHLGIPVTTPAQTLVDCAGRLARHELYRAMEEAERRRLTLDLPRLRPLQDVVRIFDQVKGRTRSDAEAAFLLICHDHGIPLPLVNHHLNGIETDFHWPGARLVVEVDGYAYHASREQFEEDRRRGLVHRTAGYEVIRVSAVQVLYRPASVAAALRTLRSLRPPRTSRRPPPPPRPPDRGP